MRTETIATRCTATSSLVALTMTSGIAFAQFSHDFETAGGYTTNASEYNDGDRDYWTRMNDSTPINSAINYNGSDGFYFAGMDINSEGDLLPLTMTFDAFSIAGLSELVFSADLAEDDDGTSEDWDMPGGEVLPDIVSFEYNVDGAGWMSIYDVLTTTPTGSDGFSNGEPEVNGTFVTDTFTTFEQALTGVTGNWMQIRVSWSLSSNQEDLAIDNLSVTGVPTPGAAVLLGLAGLASTRRRR